MSPYLIDFEAFNNASVVCRTRIVPGNLARITPSESMTKVAGWGTPAVRPRPDSLSTPNALITLLSLSESSGNLISPCLANFLRMSVES